MMTFISGALIGSEKVKSLGKGVRKLAKLESYRKSYQDAVWNHESFEESYLDVTTTLEDIESMINNGTCPVCRTSAGEEKMDLKQVQRNIEELTVDLINPR